MSEPSKPKRAARPAQPSTEPMTGNPAARHPAYAPPADGGADAAATAQEPDAKRKRKSRSGSETRKKSFLIASRYSEDEFKEVNDLASRAGLTPTGYQREQTLKTPPKTRSVRRAPVEREMLAKALGQLGRVGNNLNQLARAANIDRTERAEIMMTVAEMRGLLPVFLEALGRKV